MTPREIEAAVIAMIGERTTVIGIVLCSDDTIEV